MGGCACGCACACACECECMIVYVPAQAIIEKEPKLPRHPPVVSICLQGQTQRCRSASWSSVYVPAQTILRRSPSCLGTSGVHLSARSDTKM